MIAILLEELLGEMGHEVCAVEATESGAVSAAARCAPDLLLVDAGLSQGDGVSAVASIMHDRFVAHVFISGRSLSGMLLDPAAIVLQKPFDESALAHAMQQARSAHRPDAAK